MPSSLLAHNYISSISPHTNYKPAQAGYWKTNCKVHPSLGVVWRIKVWVMRFSQPTTRNMRKGITEVQNDQIKTTKYMIYNWGALVQWVCYHINKMLPTMDYRLRRRGLSWEWKAMCVVRWESSRGPKILRTSPSRSSPNIQNWYIFLQNSSFEGGDEVLHYLGTSSLKWWPRWTTTVYRYGVKQLIRMNI
jgi:hypothetical protein